MRPANYMKKVSVTVNWNPISLSMDASSAERRFMHVHTLLSRHGYILRLIGLLVHAQRVLAVE